MRPLTITLALLLFLLITGCGSPKAITYETLQQKAYAHHGDSFPDITYYCGTKEGYDYFYIEYGTSSINAGRLYRVETSNTPLTTRFPYTEDRDKWEKATLYTSPAAK
jgi:hypothetical protein